MEVIIPPTEARCDVADQNGGFVAFDATVDGKLILCEVTIDGQVNLTGDGR
jgi:hypothetical protein